MQRPMVAQWEPRTLVKHALELSREMFVRQHPSPFYLVVVLDHAHRELAAGLAAANASDALAFHTLHRHADEEHTCLHGQDVASPSPRRPSEVTSLRLRELAQQHCFVVALRKNSRGSFLTSISIGRARNHDLVLRHPTVSKFHATLEQQADGLFLKDVGSRNHTFLNLQRITEPALVQSGDHLRFGAVDTLLCTAAALWEAAHGGRV